MKKIISLTLDNKFYQNNPDLRKQNECSLAQQFGIWEYNHIIGYIKLHLLGTQIRGEYYSTRKPKKKLFEYRTHKLACELELSTDMNNDEILKCILSYIDSCRKELNKKGSKKYIDSSLFEKLGCHVDWKKLFFGNQV